MSDLHSLALPKRSAKGIGLVVMTHAVIVWGLASGLSPHFTKKETPPVQLIELQDPPQPVEPPPPAVRPVEFQQVPVAVIPQQPIVIDPTVVSPITVDSTPQARPGDVGPTGGHPGGAGTREVVAPPQTGPARAEAVCDVMSVPEVPAVNWSGRATFRVQASLAAGRVTEVQFIAITGGLDARSRRALQSAIQTALGAYQCRGSQAFEQEFVFNIQ